MSNFVVSLLAVILPSLLYLTLWRNKQNINTPRKHQILVLVSSLISEILCLHFAVYTHDQFRVGIQDIPFILGSLYGGYIVGAVLLTSIVAYHLFQYGSFIPHHLMVDCCLWFLSLYLIPKFHRFTIKQKVYAMIVVSFIASLFTEGMMLWATHADFIDMLRFWLRYITMQLIAVVIAVLLIETIHDQQILRERTIDAKHDEMIGELAASIAHEIRNPLTAARGFAQLLEHDIRHDKEQEFIRILIGEIDRALHITNEYLVLAKPQSEYSKTFNIAQLVQSVVTVMTPYAILHNTQIVNIESEPVFIHSNAKRLEQVLVNLVKNAIEAMPDGGQVVISSNIERLIKRITITIQDQGIGMDPEQLKKIGNPFYSTKTNGTGLGLTVSYRIIQSLGGSIDVFSKRLQGTKVVISLHLLGETFNQRTEENPWIQDN